MRKKREAEGIPKQVPHTIESLRIPDETTVNITDEKKLETEKDHELDELSSYFSRQVEPKVLITYCDNPLKVKFAVLQFILFKSICFSFSTDVLLFSMSLTHVFYNYFTHFVRKPAFLEESLPESFQTPYHCTAIVLELKRLSRVLFERIFLM